MNQLTTMTQAIVTMTSREIAELTGKEHRNVLADIRSMLAELKEDALNFQRIYLDSMNRGQVEFHLDRELTETLLTGYSAALRRKVIARWRELEGVVATAPMLPNFADPVAAARAWADAVELANGATVALSLAAPKAEALDRLTLADGAMCITNAAKTLGMQPKRLFAWMQANDWIYRRPGNGSWLAYQPRLKSLLLDHKVTTVNRADGTEKITEQVLVTAKGLAKLAEVAA